MKIIVMLPFAMLVSCSDPIRDAGREYQTALETQIELNIVDDKELCRLSRKAQRIALEKGDKASYGEWSLRVDYNCK